MGPSGLLEASMSLRISAICGGGQWCEGTVHAQVVLRLGKLQFGEGARGTRVSRTPVLAGFVDQSFGEDFARERQSLFNARLPGFLRAVRGRMEVLQLLAEGLPSRAFKSAKIVAEFVQELN